MNVYSFFFIFDALMAIVPVYFFLTGLTNGSITVRNGGLWALILLMIAGVLFGSHWAWHHDYQGLAKAILIAASIPGWILLLYLSVIFMGKVRGH